MEKGSQLKFDTEQQVSEATFNCPAPFKPPGDWATWVILDDSSRSGQLSSSQTADPEKDEQIKTVAVLSR